MLHSVPTEMWNWLRERARRIWSRPDRWIVLLSLTFAISLPVPGLRRPVAICWVGVNLYLLLRAGFWTLFHPGRLLLGIGIGARWAFWTALIVTLLLRSQIEPLLAEVTGQWLPSSVVYASSFLIFMPVLFVAGLCWGLAGASMGAFFGRQQEVHRARLTRSGVRRWWLATLGAVLLAAVGGRFALSSGYLAAILAGVPVGTLWLESLAQRWGGQTLAGSAERWLHEYFVWRRASGRLVDLRGETLALAGFLITWGCVELKLLMPLQASALLSAIQLFNAAGVGRLDFSSSVPPPADTGGRPTLPEFKVRLRPAQASAHIVLLEWDAFSLYQATTTNSEAGLHAAIINKLSAYGARRIVLPAPTLEPAAVPTVTGLHQAPDPRPEDFERTMRDLPSLETAMRHAGNVVLLAPNRRLLDYDLAAVEKPARARRDAFNTLAPAARELASSRLAPVQVAALPAIPLRWPAEENVPAPLLLFAAMRNLTNISPASLPGPGEVKFGDRVFPTLDPIQGKVLLDFVTATRGGDFARVSYESLLEDAPLHAFGATEAWQEPSKFFKDKLVFLQALHSTSLPSPLGALDPTELLAYGTRTLLGDTFVRPASGLARNVLALISALVVGRLVVRRNPLKASWRLILVILCSFTVAMIAFAQGIWLDPVYPWAAGTTVFLLVTQLTFTLERRDKERNRFLLDRFVAPEVVDELLEQPGRDWRLGGLRERVAVLFADVRGFTQFAENHSPEEVMKTVNAYLEVMTDALHQHDGLLDKYTGDGLMAMFRIERGVNVKQALNCALAMRDKVLALSLDRASGTGRALQVGISLHVGEAVVGLVGNPERQVNFTALGHTVVVAARLQTLAGGGEVIASKDVFAEAGDAFAMEARSPVSVKGISEPVTPFVVGRKPTGQDLRLRPNHS